MVTASWVDVTGAALMSCRTRPPTDDALEENDVDSSTLLLLESMTSTGMTESRSTPLAASLESIDVASTYICISEKGDAYENCGRGEVVAKG